MDLDKYIDEHSGKQALSLRNQYLDQNVQELVNFYEPSKGFISGYIQRVRSESHSKLLVALNSEQLLVIEQAEMLEKAAMLNDQNRAEFRSFIAHHAYLFAKFQTDIQLISIAVKDGLTVDAYMKKREMELASELRIKEHVAMQPLVDEKVSEAELSRIRVEEHRAKAEIDLKNEIDKATAQLQFDIISEHLEEQKKIEYIQQLINQQYVQIANIDNDANIPETAKQPMKDLAAGIIDRYMEQIDEAQKRILQSKA